MSSPAGDLRRFLAQVPDPRGRKGTRHPLAAILTAVVCAVLCGANGYQPIAQSLHSQTADFWHFLGFIRRPIKAGTLRNLLMALSPEVFEQVLADWYRHVSGGDPAPEDLQAVAIDGKALCGTRHSLALTLLRPTPTPTIATLRLSQLRPPSCMRVACHVRQCGALFTWRLVRDKSHNGRADRRHKCRPCTHNLLQVSVNLR